MTAFREQYDELKRRDPKMILLFRQGDGYEAYGEDAAITRAILDLPAPHSRAEAESGMPATWFPCAKLESFLAKLIAAGERVGVCEVVVDPKELKAAKSKPAERVVTPGTLVD